MYVLQNNRTPYIFVYCATETDVINTMTFAQQQNLPISVKSRGHCFAGYSQINFGLVIDVSLMTTMSLDSTNMILTVGSGVENHQISDFLGNGIATAVGGCPQVGLGGYTLGGGFGLLSRSMGLMCDNVTSMRVVLPPTTPGGTPYAVTVNSTGTYADLYMALLGGGNGNYGVVTQFAIKVYTIPNPMFTAEIEWPLSAPVLQAVQNWMINAEAAFCGDVLLYIDTTINKPVLYWFGVYNGDPTLGNVRYQDFLNAVPATPVAGTPIFKIQPFKDFIGADFSNPHNIFERSYFVKGALPTAACNLIIQYLLLPWGDGDMTMEFCGWAVNNPPVKNTFTHRSWNYLLDGGGRWTTLPDKAAAIYWSTSLQQALQSAGYVSTESYQNYPQPDMIGWEESYYPNGAYAFLLSCKSKYDPLNIFCYEQSIPTSSSNVRSTTA